MIERDLIGWFALMCSLISLAKAYGQGFEYFALIGAAILLGIGGVVLIGYGLLEALNDG